MAFDVQKLTECMVSLGYIPKRTAPHFVQVFVGEVQSEFGPVTVRLEGICEELIPYPKAYIVDLPPGLENRFLPHLNNDRSLCYLDEETTNLWVIDLESTLATFVEAIKVRIQEWGKDNVISRDFQQEMAAYWSGECEAFDVSENRESGLYTFYKRLSISGEEQTEVILSNTQGEAELWIKKRKGVAQLNSGIFIPIEFRQPPFVPHNINWPPKTFSQFLNWLSDIDPHAKNSLLNKILKYVERNGMLFISFRHQSEGIGFFVDITKNAMPIIQRLKPKKKSKSKPEKGYNIHESASKIARLTKSFVRSNVKDVSNSFIIQRNKINSGDSGLTGKRIALIGCGTIGGYTAHSLVQIGSGSGTSGELHLFDDDILGPGNLGRHLLGIEYLQEQKSFALKHFLENQGLAKTIIGHGKFRKNDVASRWDIIVDATGHTEFSLNLSRWINSTQWNSKRPVLIHGWIDAYGMASRALLNTEETACFGCLTVNNGQARKPRFELFKPEHKPDHAEQFRRGCGKTYMPFSAQPSLSVAGMIQQLCSQTGISFMQTRFSNQVISVKNQKLTPLANCSICAK
ncbi:ThiF family adenylyltransferase [Teredinibacter turnerae]|uniref:ThiF family adenylyltransferase n=1 Tax=Teredinibacter turnerae TaxID=2426 RepID=UPI0003806D71|nr:ThiF family adenylyltransferase [Teredinibacter turnerae]